jgi:SOS-response transcriptional repressor LexA
MDQSGCSAAEPFALRVLGDSMEPEFHEGHIVIIDPGMPATHGAFVVVEYSGDTVLRQFEVKDGRKFLKPLNNNYVTVELKTLPLIHGVVIQRATPGRRKELKHYY